MTARQTLRQAGQRLRNVTDSVACVALLTEDELDWCWLLQERFFEIVNRGNELPVADGGFAGLPYANHAFAGDEAAASGDTP